MLNLNWISYSRDHEYQKYLRWKIGGFKELFLKLLIPDWFLSLNLPKSLKPDNDCITSTHNVHNTMLNQLIIEKKD